jgi:prepilin-type N-terminal cleavage/methylation domain-containing protein
MAGKRGFTLIELLMILLILGILSVVAVPRYINIQKEVQEAGAQEFMCSLNSTLAQHIHEHHLQGVQWARNGEELMSLMKDAPAMPDGMVYENDTWTVHGASMSWKFEAATEQSAPRIVQVK